MASAAAAVPVPDGPLAVIGDPITHDLPPHMHAEGVHPSVSESVRNKYFFNNHFRCDGYLLIENENSLTPMIPIHKSIVFKAAPELRALFEAGFIAAPGQLSAVRFRGFSVRVVLSVIRWTYTGQLVYVPSDWQSIRELVALTKIERLKKLIQAIDTCIATFGITIHDVRLYLELMRTN